MENFEKQNNRENENLIITNIETYLPDDVITNKDLEEQFPEKFSSQKNDSTDRIFNLVGIKKRRTVSNKMTSTDMAEIATKRLLEKTPVEKGEKVMYRVGTVLNEDQFPSVAAKVMERLELTAEHGHHFENDGFDIGAACSGWTYGIHTVAAAMLARGYMAEIPYDKGVVITSDTPTRILGRYDSDTRILFGDAATATMVQRETHEDIKGFRIIRSSIGTVAKGTDTEDVAMPNALSLKHQGKDVHTLVMNGKKVYIHGREYTADFFRAYCEAYNVNPDDIDYFIPHQSNKKMLDSMEKQFLKLGTNKYGEDKMLSNIENVGNTVASSTPLCLFHFWKEGKFKNGDRIVLCSFGAGYTLGIVDVEVKM